MRPHRRDGRRPGGRRRHAGGDRRRARWGGDGAIHRRRDRRAHVAHPARRAACRSATAPRSTSPASGPLLAFVGAHLVEIGRPAIDLRVHRPRSKTSSSSSPRRTQQMTTITAPPVTAHRPPQDGLLRTIVRLTAVELRLLMREPGVLVSLVAFPAVTVLVLAGVFGSDPDPDFGGVIPSEHYVVGYVGVVLASLGLVTLARPPRLAPRARRVAPLPCRRARCPGRGRQPHRPGRRARHGRQRRRAGRSAASPTAFRPPMTRSPRAAWFVAGLLCFIAIGGALGAVMPSSRAATAFGNLLFVPMFLLGGGGPPREVMTGSDADRVRRDAAEPHRRRAAPVVARLDRRSSRAVVAGPCRSRRGLGRRAHDAPQRR